LTDEPSSTRPFLRRLRQGDGEALALLFDYYRSRLRHMVRLRMDTRLAARLDPSDVLQEAYLDAARQVPGYLRQSRVAFYVWLRGLTWERLLNLERHHLGAQCRTVNREVALPTASSVLLASQLIAPGTGPSRALLKEELNRRVQQALDRLSSEDREVILLRHFECLTNGQVAQTLGLTDSGATMRYGRALFRLKELLGAELNSGRPLR
jgi:RNA polymerase sigma-70 factor (ECF subfamily)